MTTRAAASQANFLLRLGVGAVIVVALILRLGYAADVAQTGLGRHPTIDPAAYLARAREILGGTVFPNDVFFQDPLYPYLLAGMLWITGGAVTGLYFVQAIVSTGNVVLVMAVGRRYLGVTAALAAGFAMAFYAPALYLDMLLEKNVFTIFFLLASLAALPRVLDWGRAGTPPGETQDSAARWTRADLWRAAASGFLLGCGALLRGNLLLVIPAMALLLLWRGARNVGWLHGVALAVLFGLASLVPIAPFTIHNYRKSGDFILTTAQAGTAFYLGNNPENVSGGIHNVSFNRQIPEFEADDWKREAERRAGHALSRKEVSQFWGAEARRHIFGDPGFGWWLGIVARKAELVLNRYEVPDNATIEWAKKHSAQVRVNFSWFATVAPLGLLGFVFLVLRPGRPAALFVVFGVYAASLLLFPISDRFRMPFALFMILCAGAAVDGILALAGARDWKKLALAGAGLALAAILVNHDPWLQPPNTNIRRENALLKAAHDEADAWIRAQEWARARAVLDSAMLDPWLASKARLNLDLAMVKLHTGDAAGARELTSKSVKAFLDEGESYPAGYQLYADISEAQQKPDVAAYWRGRVEVSMAENINDLAAQAARYAERGETARASGIADELVFRDKYHPASVVPVDAYVLLARLLLQRNDRNRAAETVAALRARGGAVPEDLRALLPP
jgi:4-amino-4-deoxy-L-arabinose transferase-like glycosyltransferase